MSVPALAVGVRFEAARRDEMIGEAMLLIVREAISRSGAVNCFVTLGLHATWRPGTVFGSDLSKGHTATARADALFECVSGACLVL